MVHTVMFAWYQLVKLCCAVRLTCRPQSQAVPLYGVGLNPFVCVVTARTDLYRRLARTQVLLSDRRCVEIGCDWGVTTSYLRQHANVTAIGVDKNKQRIAAATEKFPECSFFDCDILMEPDEFVERVAEADVVFIDINGNRAEEAVKEAIQLVQHRLSPRLIVAKSAQMGKHMDSHGHAAELPSRISSPRR